MFGGHSVNIQWKQFFFKFWYVEDYFYQTVIIAACDTGAPGFEYLHLPLLGWQEYPTPSVRMFAPGAGVCHAGKYFAIKYLSKYKPSVILYNCNIARGQIVLPF